MITHSMLLEPSSTAADLPPDLKVHIQKFIDSQMEDGFFTYSFKIYKIANYYFTIPSDWARGRAEILCLSIITRYKRPEVFKATLEAAATTIKATPYIFKAFYPDMQVNDKEVGKKRVELNQQLAQLCQDVVQAKSQAIAKQKSKVRSRDQARDDARDKTRDQDRDQARDVVRDKTRDQARDVARDKTRDQDRDQVRDKVRDQGPRR